MSLSWTSKCFCLDQLYTIYRGSYSIAISCTITNFYLLVVMVVTPLLGIYAQIIAMSLLFVFFVIHIGYHQLAEGLCFMGCLVG